MKARMERERMPAGDDPDFHLKLGRGSLADVEFTVQLLELRRGVREAGVVPALVALEGAGELSGEDGAALLESYRFCNRVRDRLFLIRGRPADSLPRDPVEGQRLAESLGYDSVGELREVYRRVTRRAKAVVDRLFWEEPS
jgi:glutamate-ammonia-ligase adenylyltransferase